MESMDMTGLANLQPPKLSQLVHREECTQCFDNQDGPLGIDVCLTCFNGGCLDLERHHARTHYQKSGHSFTLNIRRRRKPSSRRTKDEEPPAKMKKLAIIEERDEDKFEYATVIKSWRDDPLNGREFPEASSDPLVISLTDSIMQSMSSGRQSEVKAWEDEITACEHTLTLEQFSTGHIPAFGLAHCSKCDLKENLWLCLSCGSLGCGRQQFGGLGGNGHGLNHFEETHHPVSVKLGTITPEGGADIYCYSCNDSRLDPEVSFHLATFGINVQTQTKTEKSMTELQIEHNLKFDFSLTGEDGKALEPLFGPGLTGLANLGNSCYMASVMQTLFSLHSFQRRYFPTSSSHWKSCTESLPADCIDCQMHKLADGLLSGRYSHPSQSQMSNPLVPDSPIQMSQDGLRPAGFKALVGKGHEEFSTMRQQDSEEFFTYLLKTLRRSFKKSSTATVEGSDPTEVFSFGMEQRLECGDCKRVRYRVDGMDVVSIAVPVKEKTKDEEGKIIYENVLLEDCLTSFAGVEALEYHCPACGKTVIATKQTKFSTFPDILVVHAKKIQLVNWVPRKLDIPIILPGSDTLQLDDYLGKGLQPGEVELPGDQPPPSLPVFNASAMAQLEAMGFPTTRCQKALLATGNNDPEVAMEWLFLHMEDPDIDVPIQAISQAKATPEPSAEQVGMLADMGFTMAQARKALRETAGDPERAVEWLFSHPDDMDEEDTPSASSAAAATEKTNHGGSSELPAKYRLRAFISHKGPSVHSGHYVVHIRIADGGDDENSGWVLFNDEKVVKADRESVKDLKRFAYLYIFERFSSL